MKPFTHYNFITNKKQKQKIGSPETLILFGEDPLETLKDPLETLEDPMKTLENPLRTLWRPSGDPRGPSGDLEDPLETLKDVSRGSSEDLQWDA